MSLVAPAVHGTAARTARPRPWLLAPGVLVALVATACSAEEPGADAPATELTYLDSPLAEYLGEIYAPEEEPIIAAAVRREEIITQCMADQGFEYTPADVEGQIRSYSPESVATRQTEEWVVQNGYGITTTDGAATGEEATDPWADPNAEYLRTLSPASQAAFQTALVGEVSETFEPGTESCLARAGEEDGANEVWESAEFEPITEALAALQSEMHGTLTASAEMAAVTGAWSDCMADAGYPGLSAQTDPEHALAADFTQLRIDAAAAAGLEIGPGGTVPPAPVPAAALAELREVEITTALADLRCREESDYDTTLLGAQFALEQQFLDDNESALAELVAAYEQQ